MRTLELNTSYETIFDLQSRCSMSSVSIARFSLINNFLASYGLGIKLRPCAGSRSVEKLRRPAANFARDIIPTGTAVRMFTSAVAG